MIDAMYEVASLSEREGIGLTSADVDYWLDILDRLNPQGKTSMQQDVEARRKTEVEMFAGTVLALGKKHGIPCPVNQMLYDRIREIERGYGY
jgi:2-dehydropantoate 2-reductase